ncbi:hypothetical protein [Altericista sp. CCNU0014]|uniref:hypothetical protein n=1 Tax=Altericista sp. CCNU0014 TaxID=3082949 RepID=UPI003850DA8D
MFEADSPTWIAVVVASVYMLQSSTKDLSLCRWLSPFSLGWVIACLLFIHPFVLKGSWVAMGIGYVLMGALIANTLILSVMSLMPRQVVGFKSKGLETVGLLFTSCIFTGLFLLLKNGFAVLVELLGTMLQRQRKVVTP